MLTAGATTWDETRVVEPAGAGFFAMLHDHTVNVTVISWNREQRFAWRMEFTPKDVLRQRAIPAHALDLSADDGPAGTAIRIEVKDALDQLRAGEKDGPIARTIREARSLYPFALDLACDGNPPVAVPPYRAWEPDETLTVAGVGALEWQCRRGRASNEVVWDYQTFPARAFDDALSAVSETNPWARFAFHHGMFRWQIDPQCGTRPKLPDRDDLIDDAHLRAAVRALLDAATAHLRERALADLAQWADGIAPNDERAKLFTQRAPWLTHYGVAEEVLALAGWQRVTRAEYAGASFFRDGLDNDITYGLTRTTRWYRQVATAPSRAVAFTRTQMGVPTVWVQMPQRAESVVHIEGLRVHPRCHHIALCSKISVDGIGDLPWLLAEEGEFDADADGIRVYAEEPESKKHYAQRAAPGILFAGTTAQFSTWFNDHADWLPQFIALAQHQRGSLYDYDWLDPDDSLDPVAVARDVLAEVGALAPAQARQARAQYYAADDILAQITEMQTRLANLERAAKPYRALGFATTQARRMERDLVALHKRATAFRDGIRAAAEL